MNPPDRFMSFAEVARIFGNISTRTVRRKIAAHELPQPVRIGRKPMLVESEVLEVIERFKANRNQRGHA
jgi:predicted DNA-binding transcriptional regulator AlpA